MTTAVKMVKNRRYEDEKFFGMRHAQCLLCFFCLSLAYALRVNLSVALVAMTEVAPQHATRINNNHSFNATSGLAASYHSNLTPLKDYDRYQWTESEKSYILSSFFWGYILMQVPGGYIAQRYGAKMLLLIGILLCAILTILTPTAVHFGGWKLLVGVRIMEGLTQGAVHPATHAILAKWAPVEERGTLGTICYSGSQFGTIVMLATSGYVAQSSMGWPGIFYISGACCFLWAIIWCLLSADQPKDSRLITKEELKFIETSLGQNKSNSIETPTPWGSIFTSAAFISLLIVHCTHMFGFWMLLTQIPNYMKNIFKIDIKQSALLSSLPYTVMLLLSFFFVWLSNLLTKTERLSLTSSRKFFNSIGHWIPMLALIALAYVPHDNPKLAVTLLTITVGISAATYLGFQVNHIDLSPNYAGTLMGLTNGAANIMSALAPLAVGLVVTDNSNIYQWRMVFFIAAGFYFLGNLLFVIFGRTDVQKWNNPNTSAAQPDTKIQSDTYLKIDMNADQANAPLCSENVV